MKVQFTAMIITLFALTACSSGAGDTAPKPGKTRDAGGKTPTVTPPVTPAPCVPSAANNNCQPNSANVDKCWAEMLDTDAAKACSAAGKMYNRIKNICIDYGIRLKPGCTTAEIPAVNLKEAQDAIIAKLGADSNPQLDQCGTYTLDGKSYTVYFFLGKKYVGSADGSGEYHIHASKVRSPDSVTNGADLVFPDDYTNKQTLKCMNPTPPVDTPPTKL